MHDIPEYRKYSGEKQIALIDNFTISFLEKLEKSGIRGRDLLFGYDAILIPNWVREEICDSDHRRNYLETLLTDGFPMFSVVEEDYSELVNNEEGNLYRIVYGAVSTLGAMRSYLRRNVEREDSLDIEKYSDWISELYHSWPLSSETTENGRLKKKNAGEISITILAEIFSWYYPDTESITVFTQDGDCFDYQKNAHKYLKDVFTNRDYIDVSYKSNDFLLCQMYRNGTLTTEMVRSIRKDERVVTYTRRREDNSVALVSQKLNNPSFVELIQDRSTQIIF